MKIKSRLRIMAVLPVFVLALFVAIIYYEASHISEHNRKTLFSIDIVNMGSDLSALTYEYGVFRTDRPRIQWELQSNALKKHLDEASDMRLEADESGLIQQMKGNLRNANALLNEVIGIDKRAGMPDVRGIDRVYREALINKLAIELQSIIFSARKLHNINHEEIEHDYLWIVTGFIALIVILMLGIVAVSLMIIKGIEIPLRMLQAGMDRVSAGDLEYRIDLKADDELGVLASRFNVMTGHLSEITVSRNELLRETEERSRAEKALAESEEKYRIVADNTYDWEYWIGPDGVFKYVSPSCERLTGYPPQAFIEDKTLILNIMHPDHKDAFEFHLRHARDLSAHEDMEFRIVKTDGEVRWISHLCNQVCSADGTYLGRRGSNRDITERKQTEEALKENEERFRMLFNSGNDGIVVHRPILEGVPTNFLEVNDVICKRLGYSRQEMLSLSPFMIDSPDDTLDMTTVRDSIRESGQALFEKTHMTRDGRKIPVEINARLFIWKGVPTIMSVVRDITERKKAEEALRRWKHIFDHAQWGIVVGSADAKSLELMNPAFAGMHGYTVEELTGRPIFEVFAPEARAEIPGQIAIAHEKGHHVWESMHIRKDGSVFPALIDVTAVKDEKGAILYRVVNVQDITESKKTEEQLRQYAETQKILFREVNHRVKNNLAAIISMLHLEEDKAEAEGEANKLVLLRELESRIQGLLTVHTMLSGSGWKPLRMTALCEEIIRSAISASHTTQNISFSVRGGGALLSSRQAHNITLVINELTTNTIKHFTRSDTPISISAEVQDTEDSIILVYRDNGEGYPGGFIRGDFSAANIGMELVKGIIEGSLRGKLALDNDRGAVTTMVLRHELEQEDGHDG